MRERQGESGRERGDMREKTVYERFQISNRQKVNWSFKYSNGATKYIMMSFQLSDETPSLELADTDCGNENKY